MYTKDFRFDLSVSILTLPPNGHAWERQTQHNATSSRTKPAPPLGDTHVPFETRSQNRVIGERRNTYTPPAALRIATYLPPSLEPPQRYGSLLMDGGLSSTDPNLALHFHYGSNSRPCQMNEVPGQLSSLSSRSATPPAPPPASPLLSPLSPPSLCFSLFFRILLPISGLRRTAPRIRVIYGPSRVGPVFSVLPLDLSRPPCAQLTLKLLVLRLIIFVSGSLYLSITRSPSPLSLSLSHQFFSRPPHRGKQSQ